RHTRFKCDWSSDVCSSDLLEALSKRTHKRVILTELGYRATRDAAMAPATWPESDPNPHFDGEHQASCYRAALSTLWGKKWLAGVDRKSVVYGRGEARRCVV